VAFAIIVIKSTEALAARESEPKIGH
jgi:hypothetical protein